MKIGLTKKTVQGPATNQVDANKSTLPHKLNEQEESDELFQAWNISACGCKQLEIRKVACDSRKVEPVIFFALHGAKADGNTFIRDAIKRARSHCE